MQTKLISTLALSLALTLSVVTTDAIAQEKQIWFSPNNSAADFIQLFDENADWATGRSRVNVLSTHENWLGGRRDSLERRIVPFIQRTGIQLALEVGGLRSHNLHGADVDQVGELTAQDELAKIRHIYDAGGEVTYLHMDSPIGYTLASGGDTICAFDPSQSASELADYMEAVLAVHPDLKFVLIEPVPWYHIEQYPSNPGQDRGDLLEILQVALDTLDSRGLSLDAFHADSPCNYNQTRRLNSWPKLVRLQQWVQDHGMQFGLILNDETGGNSGDSAFFAGTMTSYQRFTEAGGNPDNLPLMSWYPYPSRLLPEDEPYTYTNLLKEFCEGLSAPEDQNKPIPQFITLNSFPNPFNSTARIQFTLPGASKIRLTAFDLTGREVSPIAAGDYSAGAHSIEWRADGFPSGYYFVKLASAQGNAIQSIQIIK